MMSGPLDNIPRATPSGSDRPTARPKRSAESQEMSSPEYLEVTEKTLLSNMERKKLRKITNAGQKSRPTSMTSSPVNVIECVICSDSATGTNTARCDLCSGCFHLDCCGVSTTQHPYARLLIGLMGWTCPPCRSAFHSGSISSVAALKLLTRELYHLNSLRPPLDNRLNH